MSKYFFSFKFFSSLLYFAVKNIYCRINFNAKQEAKMDQNMIHTGRLGKKNFQGEQLFLTNFSIMY